MPVNIDFAPPSWRPRFRDCALLAGALLAVAAAGWSAFEAWSEQREVVAERQRRSASIVRVRDAVDPALATAVNQAIRQLNLPWDALFAAVEGSAGDRVSLLAIEPDAQRRSLRISGEAKTANDMIDFLERLESTDFIVAVDLVRHEINESDRNRPYRFVAEAGWGTE